MSQDRGEAPDKPKKSVIRRIVDGTAMIAVLGMLAWSLLFLAFAPELPDTTKIWDQESSPGIIILAADDSELARRGGLARRPVGLNKIPDDLINALVATEDRRFFKHFGIDVIGLGRATLRNLVAGRVVEGGSTITQQLAKNLYLTPERSLNRKIQEMFLAIWLEARLTKKEILMIYLNRVYFGAGAYGVEAAARLYFAKPITELDLAQSAMLAGMLKAPSRLAPTTNPKRAVARASVVLSNMVATGYITEAQAKKARRNPAKAVASRFAGSGRYFVDWVLSELPDGLKATDRDLVVTTTLEPSVQASGEAAVAWAFRAAGKAKVGEAALVALGRDGRVRAMIGGRDYRANSYNRATRARRQPGSAFKPVVYAAALEAGLRPSSKIDDSKITIEGWTPVNYNGRYNGRMRLSDALARSVNPAVVRLQERVGRDRVIDVARRLGITSKLTPVPSLALGSAELGVMELTAAYLPFITKGLSATPYGISRVETRGGRVLYRRGKTSFRRALEYGVANDMRRMLEGAVASGTGRRAALAGTKVGGKTGTSQSNRDAWFVGFTGDTVAGVWFGNDDDSAMPGVAGGGLPARTWKRFMAGARRSIPLPAPRPVQERRDGPGPIAGLLGRVADTVIDGVFGAENQDGDGEGARESAKGILRWFIGKATSDPDQPPEDFGK